MSTRSPGETRRAAEAPDAVGSPFHRGEQAAQRRAGVRARTEAIGRRIIHGHLPEQHRAFFAQLPFVVLGGLDRSGQPWASALAGPPGFAHSPAPDVLRLDAAPAVDDPLADAADGAELGLLGIELHTRRRNRVSGRLRPTEQGWAVHIGQAFGNCPQYIHPRVLIPDHSPPGPARRRASLSPWARALVQAADTFFIATAAPAEPEDLRHGVDVSHRGGPPGFVTVDGDGLSFPDYPGNGHFNTIGNLLLEPRAGLLFVHFATGDLLHLAGEATVDWPDEGAGPRAVRLRVTAAVERPAGLPLRLAPPEDQGWRRFAVERVVDESDDVRSLWLAPADGGVAPPFAPGRSITVRAPLADGGSVIRSYSLSRAADGARYRISVKRIPGGAASSALHRLSSGDAIELREPAGDFVLDQTSEGPVLLLAAGVGITPLMPMLHTLAGGPRPALMVHAARDGAHHPLGAELRRLAAYGARTHVVYSRPRPEDAGRFDGVGRIDRARLASLGVGPTWQAYLCGPPGFVADMSSALAALGLPADAIFSEDFGAQTAAG